MYQEGTFFALMRYLSGFGGWILHESDENPLKRKFNNCLRHCLAVYDKLYAHLPKQEETKADKPREKFTCRVMMSHVDRPHYGWELMSHRDDPQMDYTSDSATRVMLHRQTGMSCNLWTFTPKGDGSQEYVITFFIDECWFMQDGWVLVSDPLKGIQCVKNVEKDQNKYWSVEEVTSRSGNFRITQGSMHLGYVKK